jgi:hypothetical protein
MKSKLAWLVLLIAGVAAVQFIRQQAERTAALRSEIEDLRREQESARRLLQTAALAPLIRAIPAPSRPEAGLSKTAGADPSSRPGLDKAAVREPQGAPPALGNDSATSKESNSERWAKEAEAYNEAVEAEFASQASNPAWASTTRSDLLAKVDGALPAASSVQSVECRSSVCRLEASFPNEDASQALFEKMFTEQGHFWKGPAAVASTKTNADGSLTKVLYLAREGASLLSANP